MSRPLRCNGAGRHEDRRLRFLSWTLVAVLLLPAESVLAGQGQPTKLPAETSAAPDPEAEERAAPVLLSGEPVIWITAGAGPYTPQFRAERIGQRLEEVVHDRTIHDPRVTITETEGSSELRVGSRLLMVVTPRDVASVGVSRAVLAQQLARNLEAGIRAERWRYAPQTLLRSGLFGLLATLALIGAFWVVHRLTRAVRRVLEDRVAPRSQTFRVLQKEVLSAEGAAHAMAGIVRAIRVVFVLVVLDVYLTFVLGLFPWTRAVSRKLVDYAMTPVRAVGEAAVGYLPKLFFLIVITAIFYAAIKLVALFFHRIRDGRLIFANFPAEWAEPTNKIVRVLLIAFGLVVAFPYLPASDSPAFAGVSVFLGVLFSLASSSALSNMISGIVLTYTGAFRLGDRVKVGDGFGDIIEMSLLATRVRTIKNEDITIPNSLVMGAAITNYSREASTLGLILHTTVTIGYDAPWRKVHHLLIDAALATPGIVPEPQPFVWQTALNDFYVSYEINAYTRSPVEMVDIYAALHAHIQDEFYAAGVEIMSPHYTSIRDGNTVAIPEALRGPGYEAAAFRVTDVKSRTGVRS